MTDTTLHIYSDNVVLLNFALTVSKTFSTQTVKKDLLNTNYLFYGLSFCYNLVYFNFGSVNFTEQTKVKQSVKVSYTVSTMT